MGAGFIKKLHCIFLSSVFSMYLRNGFLSKGQNHTACWSSKILLSFVDIRAADRTLAITSLLSEPSPFRFRYFPAHRKNLIDKEAISPINSISVICPFSIIKADFPIGSHCGRFQIRHDIHQFLPLCAWQDLLSFFCIAGRNQFSMIPALVAGVPSPFFSVSPNQSLYSCGFHSGKEGIFIEWFWWGSKMHCLFCLYWRKRHSLLHPYGMGVSFVSSSGNSYALVLKGIPRRFKSHLHRTFPLPVKSSLTF